jgi:hypothetical protein
MRVPFLIATLGLAGFAAHAQLPGGPTPRAELTDALQILRNADNAVRNVRAVQYVADYRGAGPIASTTYHVTGVVILGNMRGEGQEDYFLEVKVTPPEGGEPKEFRIGCNRNQTFVIDPQSRKVHADIDSVVLGSLADVVRDVSMYELVRKQPFRDAIAEEAVTLRGRSKVGEEECYEIHVKYKNRADEALWFISMNDFLPRRVDRYRRASGAKPSAGDAAPAETDDPPRTVLTVTQLQVNPGFNQHPFLLRMPPGYRKTDDPFP